MNRREALKCMGVTLLSGAVASSGLLSFAACSAKGKKRVVLYFTGTGNCLYIARQLAGKDGEILSILQLVKNRQFDIEADEIGLVYPIYGHMPPHMVREGSTDMFPWQGLSKISTTHGRMSQKIRIFVP